MDSRDTAVAANLLSRKIDTWIEDLRIYAKTAPGLRGGGGAEELMVEHRAGGGLTCKTASGGFGSGPGMETLVAVGHSLGGGLALSLEVC